jgi:hypothetical protein
MPLLSRLFLLVAAALMPAIAVRAHNEIDLRRTREMEVQRHALELARLAAAEQQQFVQGIRQVLIALSELPAIKAKDTQACEAYLSKIKEQYPEFITLVFVDMNANAFCFPNSRDRPPATGRAYFANAVKNRRLHSWGVRSRPANRPQRPSFRVAVLRR